MSTYTSPPFPTIFQGVAQVPSQFVVNYRGLLGTDPVIKFTGILEDGSSVALNGAAGTALDATVNDAIVVASAFAPIIGYWFAVENVENIAELSSIVMVTKHGIPLTQSLT